jgi:hypothetical protein
MLADLIGENFCESNDRCLAAHVGRHVRNAHSSGCACDINDAPLSAGNHGPDDRFAAKHGPFEVYLDIPPPFVGVGFPRWPEGCADACRINEQTDGSELILSDRDHFADSHIVCNVGGDRNTPDLLRAQQCYGSVQFLGVSRSHGNM